MQAFLTVLEVIILCSVISFCIVQLIVIAITTYFDLLRRRGRKGGA